MSKRLVVIEGLDGSGKATQTDLLCNALTEMNQKVLHISFPDYNEPSSTLAKMLLEGKLGGEPEDINAYASSAFFSVDRIASFVQFWKKNYENGDIIVADRYTTSNQIYQTATLSNDQRDNLINWLEDFEYNKLGLPAPNLVIYIDMPPEISQKLMSKRYCGDEGKKDIYEKNVGFLHKCHKSALYCAVKLGWRKVACFEGEHIRTPEEIHEDIMRIVKSELLR